MNRESMQFNDRYLWAVPIVFAVVFGLHLFVYGSYANIILQYLFGIALPLCMGTFLLFFAKSSEDTLFRVMDKSVNNMTQKHIPLVSYNALTETYYYLPINATISPIFSIGAIFNIPTLIFGAVFFLGFLAVSANLIAAVILSVIAFSLCWLVFVGMNLMTILKLKRYKRGDSANFVDMNYTIAEYEKMIKKQAYRYKTPKQVAGSLSSPQKDLFELLLTQGIHYGFQLNNFILLGYSDPKLVKGEIETLEYILNDFTVKAIKSTNEYFAQYKDKGEAAVRVYNKEVYPKLFKEALELKDKLDAVKATIKAINTEVKRTKDQRKASIEYEKEQSISVDGALALLAEKTVLPVIEFPEFHTLHFQSNQKKTAAQNIVKGSLIALVEAKEQAELESDKQKLDGQIEEIKTFVKALASGTPESEDRERRIMKREQEDPLYLENNLKSLNDVDNMIAVSKNYINSYDETLPAKRE